MSDNPPLPPAELGPPAPGGPLQPGGCPRCGSVNPAWTASCLSCGIPLTGKPPLSAPVETVFPWEDRGRTGYLSAGWKTFSQVLLHPGRTFALLKDPPALGEALFFFLLFGCGGALVGSLWGVLMNLALRRFLPNQPPPPPDFFPPWLASWQEISQGPGILLIGPLARIAFLILFSLLAHLGLLITRSPRRSLASTMSVYAYAIGATGLCEAIPFCGAYVPLIWGTVCFILGLRQVHGSRTWQAIFSGLLGYLTCCCAGGITAAFYLPKILEHFRKLFP